MKLSTFAVCLGNYEVSVGIVGDWFCGFIVVGLRLDEPSYNQTPSSWAAFTPEEVRSTVSKGQDEGVCELCSLKSQQNSVQKTVGFL